MIVTLGLLVVPASGCTGDSIVAPSVPVTIPTTTEGEVNFQLLISDEVIAIGDFAEFSIEVTGFGVHQSGEPAGWHETTFPDPMWVDLTEVLGLDAEQVWSGSLEPGDYDKIFIYVNEITAELKDGSSSEDAPEVKLPSNKLQINKPFTVPATSEGENPVVNFVYDITVINAGQSGQYILKPQVDQSGAGQEFNLVNQSGQSQKNEEKHQEKNSKPEKLEFQGTIVSIDDDDTSTVNIDGEERPVDVSEAEIEGEPEEGLEVKFQGSVDGDTIVATEVEVIEN